MSLDSIALVWGSAAIGLAPLLCFFFQIVYPKSQLLIVAISAAFTYLVSAVISGFCWYILVPVIGLSSGWCAIAPAVMCQFFFRVGFVKMYHKVEQAIEQSIAISDAEREKEGTQGDDSASQGTDADAPSLKLELNDAASGIASGVGFGVRRRVIFPRGGGNLNDMNPRHRQYGAYYGNTRMGGNMALLTVLISHFCAAGFTTFNLYDYGCNYSLPLVAGTALVVGYLFRAGISRIYKPLPFSSQRLSLPASFSYASHANGVGENENGVDYVEQMRSEG
eukprot:scaffold1356_cov123-Cylindrotheca_fusiformis.AAC.27